MQPFATPTVLQQTTATWTRLAEIPVTPIRVANAKLVHEQTLGSINQPPLPLCAT
jgi:hypothetical protein